MFNGFTSETIDFLWGIRFNNHREWFLEHKKDYEQKLYRPMLALAEQVGEQVKIDNTVIKTSRIYRDVRYSNGIPYKDHLWFCIREDNVFWSEHPSLYFEISPEGGSCGFIFYSPKASIMEQHRKKLLEYPDQFQNIMSNVLKDPAYVEKSTRYKRPKAGFLSEGENWYQLKNCFVQRIIPVGEELFSPELCDNLVKAFYTLQPLYQYFRELESQNP